MRIKDDFFYGAAALPPTNAKVLMMRDVKV